MAIHCTASERGGLIKKKKRKEKKESSLVKLKAFRHLSGGLIRKRGNFECIAT